MTSLLPLGSRSYSGRGMYGKRCLAFDSLDVLLAAIRNDSNLPVNGWQWDSMGRDFIWYNPSVNPPIGGGGPDSDADNDEYDGA